MIKSPREEGEARVAEKKGRGGRYIREGRRGHVMIEATVIVVI